MAASISDSPGSILAPLCERLWYTLTGYNPASQYKYRYVIDIYLDGTQVARVLRSPDPGSNDAKFNLRPLVEEYLTGDPEGDSSYPLFSTPAVTGDLFDKFSTGECVKVEVKIGESVASSATGEPVLTANQDTETLYVWNGEIRKESTRLISDFYLTNTSKYLLSDRKPSTYRWAKQPSAVDSSSIIIPIWEDGFSVLSFLNDDGTYASGQQATKVEYIIATSSGESSSQYATIGPTPGGATPGGTVDANQKLLRLAAGPGNLEGVTDPVLTDLPDTLNWVYYKLRLVNDSNIGMSRWYVFVRREGCSKENRYALHWKCEAGGWDFFEFEGVTIQEDQHERKFYRRQPTYQEYGWETDHLRPSQIFTQVVYKLTSRFIQSGEKELLRSLFRSKQIWLHSFDSGEEFIPVVIKASSFQPLKETYHVNVEVYQA